MTTATVVDLTDADAVLERRIWRARRRLESAADVTARRMAWNAMPTLIEQRSPHQVERMERARGLR